jgi:glycosyltransferase involved in cell wall biosynthesis
LGEGPLAGQITQRIERLHLQGFVEVGFTPDLSPLLCRARVFVSLQRQDNYPSQSLLEAMSCGTSTVATDVGLTWQLVDEDTGIRVKPDPEDIAKAVVTLLRDPQRCRRLGHAARARVLAQHSEERYAKYVKEQYARIAERVA